MKFNIKTYSLIGMALMGMALQSCEDFLDRQEDEKMTFEKIWADKNYTKQYWLNAMSFIPRPYSNYIGDVDPYLGAADECVIGYNRSYRYINYGSWNASNIPYHDRVTTYYQGIRECNILMQNVYSCSDATVDRAELDRYYWQARFARAYYYWLMMRDMGPVFLLGDELVDFTLTTEELYRPRNTWEECVDYVVSELTEVANSSVIKEVEESNYWGLATKGTCYAVIGRLQLYSARDLFNGNTLYANLKNPQMSDFPELSGVNLFPQTYDATKWLTAAQTARKIIDMGIYELFRYGNNNPTEDYTGILNEAWNSELIWTEGLSNRFYPGVAVAPTGLSGTAYGAAGPTQAQVDAYAMSNGKYPITGYEKNGTPIVDEESGYNLDTELTLSTYNYPYGGIGLYDDWSTALTLPNMYKNREPRFYASVFVGGSYWLHASNITMISFAKGGNGYQSHDYPPTGYLINRYYDHRYSSTQSSWGSNITFPTYRLAEVYLNYIEAVLECQKRGVSMPGDYYSKAMECWDDIRDRAGVPAILDVYPNATVDELIDLCRRERRVELAFENHRYFDTRTWKIATETDNGDVYGMNTECPIGTDLTATPADFWKRTVTETRVFKDQHYFYPFSQRQLDRNKILTQNYGW